MNKKRAPRNRTLNLSKEEIKYYSDKLIKLDKRISFSKIINKTIWQDTAKAIEFLPDKFVDLLFIDPPYNLSKTFNSIKFKEKSIQDYSVWIESFLQKMLRLLKPTASIYICGDWRSSSSLQSVLGKYFKIRNRITWEREKGRGSKSNWKNNSEDIWYCTLTNDYIFNFDSVKMKRKVLAPYRLNNGNPKDWIEEKGGSFRLTYPSNIWTDISVPFWSMPENTDHPTQKPEKLLAKILLASSNPGQVIFDPFLGSGTTSVTAKKLDRNYVGIEIDKTYACLAEKRLTMVDRDKSIQGYREGIFWERNTVDDISKIRRQK